MKARIGSRWEHRYQHTTNRRNLDKDDVYGDPELWKLKSTLLNTERDVSDGLNCGLRIINSALEAAKEAGSKVLEKLRHLEKMEKDQDRKKTLGEGIAFYERVQIAHENNQKAIDGVAIIYGCSCIDVFVQYDCFDLKQPSYTHR